MPRKEYTRIEWTEDRLALLGMQTDTSLADQLGVSWSVVITKRKALGIPRFDPLRDLLTKRPVLLDQLGALPDTHIAALAGVSPSTVGKYRESIGRKSQTPEKLSVPKAAIPYLGTATDKTVAEMFGCRESAIHGMRKRKGIPRFDPLKALLTEQPELNEQFGVMPDSYFAELAGVSLAKIRRYRRAIDRKSTLRVGRPRPSSAMQVAE